MKTDSLFYRLFQRAPALVFELAGLDPPAAGAYQFRAKEIKQTAFRLDGVLAPPPEQPDAPVVFVEVQAQPDPEFYGRFFAELLLYLYRNQPPHPWRAVVIYPTRAEERLNLRHYGSLVSLPEVRRVYLEDFRDRPVTGAGVGLIQLIVSEPEGSLPKAAWLLRQARTALMLDAINGVLQLPGARAPRRRETRNNRPLAFQPTKSQRQKLTPYVWLLPVCPLLP